MRAATAFTVADPAERERILDLRREPYLAALMAGEMLRRDTLRIEKRIGRYLTGGEIYLVHFLGPDGAQTFIDQFGADPDKDAAVLLPKPAEANKSIFYDKDGGLSVAEVKEKFEKMISSAPRSLPRGAPAHGRASAGAADAADGRRDASESPSSTENADAQESLRAGRRAAAGRDHARARRPRRQELGRSPARRA